MGAVDDVSGAVRAGRTGGAGSAGEAVGRAGADSNGGGSGPISGSLGGSGPTACGVVPSRLIRLSGAIRKSMGNGGRGNPASRLILSRKVPAICGSISMTGGNSNAECESNVICILPICLIKLSLSAMAVNLSQISEMANFCTVNWDLSSLA